MKSDDELEACLRWLYRSKVRNAVFTAVLSYARDGMYPSGKQVIKRCGQDWCRSAESNASQAIRDLITRGFLSNAGVGRAMKLTRGPLWDVLSDMREDEGRPRLDWLNLESEREEGKR